jgi:hypothetical protein
MILVGVSTCKGDFTHGLVVLIQELPNYGDTK